MLQHFLHYLNAFYLYKANIWSCAIQQCCDIFYCYLQYKCIHVATEKFVYIITLLIFCLIASDFSEVSDSEGGSRAGKGISGQRATRRV